MWRWRAAQVEFESELLDIELNQGLEALAKYKADNPGHATCLPRILKQGYKALSVRLPSSLDQAVAATLP